MKHQDDRLRRPIFVMGPPRCGTTLVAKILGRHPRIFMPGETHFFDDIYSRRLELGDLHKGDIDKVMTRLRTIYSRFNETSDQRRIDRLLQEHEAVERLRTCRSYENVLSCFMELQARMVGKVRWGNNVPKDIFHVKEILSFYPDAKILICIRDVRDFLCSYKNKWTTASEGKADRLRKLYHPILTSLLWKASVKQISRVKKLVRPDNLLIVRYESLVDNPPMVVQKICRFIGEDFADDMIRVNEQNSSFEVLQGGIYSSSVGRWRLALTKEEAYSAQKVANPWLDELGYATEHLDINPFKLAYIWSTLPFSLWRAVYVNRAVREPFIPYVTRRIAALGG